MVEQVKFRGKRVPMPLKMPPSIRERLEAASKATGHSLNQIVILLLDAHLPILPETVRRPRRPSRPIETRVVE